MQSRPLVDCLTRAASFYRGQLRASPKAIGYLKSRGLRGETAARYGVGYAPAGFQRLREVFPDYGACALESSGLITKNDAGRRYDRFRDRIMFPISNDAGDIIGFGGRVIESGAPKYLNSPETELFHKGEELFGLRQATDAIASSSTVFVVEGYLDVLSLAQHGQQNVVATMGTAVTYQQIVRLLLLAKRVVFCFDGDDAGRLAAARALSVCLPFINDSVDVSFLFLPRDQDPDSFVREQGIAAFRALQTSSFEEFFINNAAEGCSLKYAEGRARLVATATPWLQSVEAPALLGRLLDALSEHACMTVDELIEACGLENKAIDRP